MCLAEGVFVRNEPNEPAKQVRLVKKQADWKTLFSESVCFYKNEPCSFGSLDENVTGGGYAS